MHKFCRSSALVLFASTVFLTVFILQKTLAGTPTSEWGLFLFLLALTVVCGFQSAGRLLSTFRLSEDLFRQERPLHADKDIPLGEVCRMFIGRRSVEICVSPGPEPDLEFVERWLEGGDELIGKLARRLPPDAEIECPSGELAGRLAGRA